MCMKVDLPDPDGPMTATNSPVFDREIDAVEGADRVVHHRIILDADC